MGEIEHRMGATDVVLRLERGGGFVPIEYLATEAPTFTLYGNGVVVFQRAGIRSGDPDANGIVRGVPWRTASLDEDQIQALLAFALGLGGLGTARERYPSTGIADAPDTIFTVHAGGVDKTVTVNALGMEPQPGPDADARIAFRRLSDRLVDFDHGGSIATDVFQPDRYRAVLTVREAAGPGTVAWPWPAIDPSDFVSGSADAPGGPIAARRAMSADEVAALNVTGIEGGVEGLTLRRSDGKTYALILRPLLVDEAS